MMHFHQVPPNAKKIADLGMYGEKPLGMSNGFESSHHSFPLPRWLMRYFCLFVVPFLHQEINAIPILIPGSPQVNMLTMTPGEYHIKIPGATQSATPFYQLVYIFRPKPGAPVPN
jgi:hypothetical protein